jgi:hypothetical protein
VTSTVDSPSACFSCYGEATGSEVDPATACLPCLNQANCWNISGIASGCFTCYGYDTKFVVESLNVALTSWTSDTSSIGNLLSFLSYKTNYLIDPANPSDTTMSSQSVYPTSV